MEEEDYGWVKGGSKSIALLWLRQKNSDLMQIANALKPQDPTNEYEMDIFLDLVSIYGAITSAIDMVEDVQNMVWAAEAKNSDLKLTIRQLTKKIKTYEDKFDNLNEHLK
jgi:predicted RNase H-like nuclease (RuvC/YqgF family)